ncbi:hypothetical protein [Phycicoccus sonneratiae]|uniref:Lipoprotein n=1 Tax=Phycicoccus sonneratiae TaxID=2807628 RepID=A0ABS2CJT9_9MICO|nr:hypothetical protein [Phycicoccus sonneraticus]MBM6400143.1 hypothetical protein [Phycicoccus sonneraticus]
MKRSILSALALSGALVLGACGSATNDTAGGSKAAATSEAPAAASAKVGDTVDLAELATKSSAAVKEKGTAHMTMQAATSGTIEADADYSGDSPKMAMTVSESGDTFQMVYLDKVMYMGGDSFAEMTGGKKWIKIDPQGDDMMSKMMGPMLDQMESTVANPAEQLKGVEGATATVTKVADGVTTYQVKLSKEQLAAMVKKQAAGLPGLTEEALKKVPDGVTYDMSVDAEGLPVTVAMDMGGEKMTITYSKWGEPVEVKAPAASEVGTFQMPTS